MKEDGRKHNGGSRHGSGRKRKELIAEVSEIIESVSNGGGTKKVWLKVVEKSLEGSAEHIKLLLKYKYALLYECLKAKRDVVSARARLKDIGATNLSDELVELKRLQLNLTRKINEKNKNSRKRSKERDTEQEDLADVRAT